MLSTFADGSNVDAALFRANLEQLLGGCRQNGSSVTVRVFGEMVDLLWRDVRAAFSS